MKRSSPYFEKPVKRTARRPFKMCVTRMHVIEGRCRGKPRSTVPVAVLHTESLPFFGVRSDSFEPAKLGLQSDLTSDVKTESTETQTQTSYDLDAIEMETLSVTQRLVRNVLPISKGNSRSAIMVVLNDLTTEALLVEPPAETEAGTAFMLPYYQRGHMESASTLDYERRAHEVVGNYENLTLWEKALVPPGAYMRLKHILTPETAKKKLMITLNIDDEPMSNEALSNPSPAENLKSILRKPSSSGN